MQNNQFHTLKIQQDNNQTLSDIKSVSFNNYSDKAVNLYIDGISRELPPPQLIDNVKVPIEFSISDNELFDIAFRITFQEKNNSLVLIDYITKPNC